MVDEVEQNVAQSTMMREAYFVDFAIAMRKKVNVPLMVTGGFRQRTAMEQALESGASDLIGEALGDVGKHARAAVSAPALPLGVAVEIEGIFQIA